MSKLIVIGGGPAGCAATYVLRKRGHEVHLFEAKDHVGGRTKQLRRDGFNLASGALFLMGGIYPRTNALMKEMNTHGKCIAWKGASQLLDKDDTRYPVSFVQLQTYLNNPKLTLGDRLRVVSRIFKLYLQPGAKNPFDGSDLAKYDTGENLEEWSLRVLGKRPYEYLIRPVMDFLYAVPASWLSTPFPQAIIQQALTMKLSVPPEGVGQLSDWFIEKSPGAHVYLNSPVERIERVGNGDRYRVFANGQGYEADGLVVATESFVAAKLLKDFISDETERKLLEAPYTDYAHVAIGYRKDPWPSFPADIVLPVGADEIRNVGALVLHGRRQPNSVPEGGQMVGVYFNTPPLAHMSDDDIRRDAVAITHRAFGVAPEPEFVHLFRYKRGLTIAKPGHYGRLDSVHKEMPANIFLAGDYFSQAGVEAAVFSGEKAALQLNSLMKRSPTLNGVAAAA